jgi:hypothetical protein
MMHVRFQVPSPSPSESAAVSPRQGTGKPEACMNLCDIFENSQFARRSLCTHSSTSTRWFESLYLRTD